MEEVKDAEKWQDMSGKNDLEKKLNSYLTCRFIVRYGIPSDECESESQDIIKISKANKFRFDEKFFAKIEKYLVKQFCEPFSIKDANRIVEIFKSNVKSLNE